MDRLKLKTKAKETLKNNQNLYLYYFIFLIIAIVLSTIPVISILAVLFEIVGFYYLLVATFSAIKGEKPSLDFQNTKNMKVYLLLIVYTLPGAILYGLGFGLIFACSMSGKAFLLATLGAVAMVVGMVSMFIIEMTYALAIYMPFDEKFNGLTSKEYLQKSKEYMTGHLGEYFVLTLSFIPWILLCCITCGIGFIYVLPYMQLTFVNYYLELTDGYVELV